MRPARTLIISIVAFLLSLPALAAAQEPVRDFTQLNTRLRPGDTVWVTDSQGRKVKGTIASLAPSTITLKGDGSEVFDASEVSAVRRRGPGRRTEVGIIAGAIVGVGLGITACSAYPKDDPLRGDACLMSIGLMWIPGLGAGALVGAMFPGKKQAVYRAAGTVKHPPTRFSIAPVVTPRSKGVAFSLAF